MRTKLGNWLWVASASLIPSLASASGFQIIEQSPSGIGTAFAGSAVVATDASTIYGNPAGMTHLSQPNLVSGANLIMIQAEFTNSNSLTVQSADPLVVTPTLGPDDDGGTSAVVPNLYYTQPISDRMVVGFGLNAPFGLVTEYDDDWVGRYVAIKSDLATINFNPSIAYKVNDQLSLGFGIDVQYVDVELTNAIDLTRSGSAAMDGKAEIEGDDFGFGWNVGLLYEPTERTRIGLSYRSKIKSSLKGEAEFDLPTGFEAYGAVFHEQDVSADLTFPETVTLSVGHAVGQSLTLLADVAWTRWSRFQELDIDFSDPVTEATAGGSIEEAWDNTFRYSVGATYQLNNALLLRGGVAYDQTPVPNDELRSPRIPDNDRIWLAGGFRWAVTDSMDLDFGYVHIFVKESHINISSHSAGHILQGTVDGAVDIFSGSISYRF